jgi:uncharacterized membrane protein YccC
MSAVVCCLFATRDDPAPAIAQFLRGSSIAIIVDGVYLFAILPAIDGFVMLTVALAPAFILYGLLNARPATAPIRMALAAMGATLLALQETYSADFSSFVNSGIATVIGMGVAGVLTKLIRSVGADWSAWRLVRSNWLSLAEAAKRRGRGDRAAFAGLMVDRIGLVAMRLSRITVRQAAGTNNLQVDLRIGLNIIDLRRARQDFPPAVLQAVDAALDGVAEYYRALVRRGPFAEQGQGPGPTLLRRIDEAMPLVSSLPGGTARRYAIQGLVGIRLGLYADAAPFTLAPDPSDTNQQVAA